MASTVEGNVSIGRYSSFRSHSGGSLTKKTARKEKSKTCRWRYMYLPMIMSELFSATYSTDVFQSEAAMFNGAPPSDNDKEELPRVVVHVGAL